MIASDNLESPPIVKAGGRLSSRSLPRTGDLLAGLFVVVMMTLMLLGPWLAPYSTTAMDPKHILLSPRLPYIFGTDEFGRDVFSRIVAGASITLLPAILAAGLGVTLGVVTGMVSGYYGGRTDGALMRLMDVLLSFPALILAMLIVVVMGSNVINVILAIGVVFWPRSARLIRSVAVDLSKLEFIDAARARGESTFYVIFREMFPNILPFVIVDFSLRMSYGILLTASLSYLGIGVHPPSSAWGLMVKEGQQYIQFAPWIIIFPCVAISLVCICAVLFGERMRKILLKTSRFEAR
jgi:peptide/nickel transport system permease protein